MPYSIVIPNYNGREVISPLLEQIQSWMSRHPMEVIVVDDASTDDSVHWITEKFPFVRLIVHKKNLGFPQTSNDGVQAARFPAVILLNNDVALLEGDAMDLVSPVVSDPNVFAVVPLIIGRIRGVDVCESSMRFIFRQGAFHIQNTSASDLSFSAKTLSPIAYATATACCYSREKFLALGGFEGFFSPGYYEDVDLCFKAYTRDWKVLVQPAVKFRHWTSTTFDQYGLARREILSRNGWLMQWLWLPRNRLVLHVLWIPYHLFKSIARCQWWRLKSFVKALMRFRFVFTRRSRFVPTLELLKRVIRL